MSKISVDFNQADYVDFAPHSYVQEISPEKDFLIVDALMLYEGQFEDSKGQDVKVTKAIMQGLVNFYKLYLGDGHPARNAIRRLFNKEPQLRYKNVSLNHDKRDALKVVGKILSIEIKEFEEKAYLFGKLKILGRENVERVLDGRFSNMSISYDFDLFDNTAELKEISYVFDSAIDHVTSFSAPDDKTIEFKPKSALKNGKISIELEKCRNDLNSFYTKKTDLEKKIQSLEFKKSASIKLGRLVKDGLISKSDHKRLMVDMESLDSSPHEVIVRAISTVAKSRKAMRGRFNSNFSASAFESFVDNVITPTSRGDKMTGKKFDPEDTAKKIVEALNSGKTAADFASAEKEKEKIAKESDKVDDHTEDKHTVRFKPEDMSRLQDLAKKSGSEELCNFLKDMGCSSDKDMGKNDKEEEEKTHHDYAKLEEKIIDLQKELKTTGDAIVNLTNKIVDLSTGKTAEGTGAQTEDAGEK